GWPRARLLLGELCLADDDFDAARHHWEAAFGELRRAGDLAGAIRAAADLAMLHASAWGNASLARGWIERGGRLVRQMDRCVEAGYLALAILGCDQPDVTAVERNAELALALALEFGDHSLEVRALAEWGFALVAEGNVPEGFRRLEEAMAAITAGEVSEPGIIGMSFCSMLSACDRSGETARAQEWTAVVAEYLERHGGGFRILHTHCRITYGSVLCSIGRWPEAEAVILEALSPRGSKALSHRAEASAHLADLRIGQGRLEEAAALLAPFEDCIACCAPLARLHLARGNADLAAAVVDRGLAVLVGDRVRAAPLLALLVEAEVARHRPAAAAAGAAALQDLVAPIDSPVFDAEAAVAAARAASAAGEPERAVRHLVAAQRRLAGHDRPAMAALVHLELARALGETGRRAQAVAEGRAAQAIFSRLGARRDADRVAAVLRGLGERGLPGRPPPAPSLLSRRERDVLDLVREGLTNAEIGRRLFISPKTAEHHVSRVLMKLGVRSRAEAAALAAGWPGSRPDVPVVGR
ncbi:MAG TPA: LuxR C-terminal-related transcriptional regulator, partial [Acidimicrobiales bacterium]|nr:LuxR C-terminal-related transcriptional regulator [Acidimicrobiales bacterium]